MKSHLKLNSGRIRIAEQFEASASDMLAAVRQQQLEGVIGKRKDRKIVCTNLESDQVHGLNVE